ncbi:hypothetical protein JTB14_026105 [Gonioctena quinquepunctata]|nr:hypothetical protein JTB14_026105 [Gonioctena quinquepunctata]
MTVLGEADLNLNLRSVQQNITFKMVEKNVPPILERKSCKNSGLVMRVHHVKYTNEDEDIFKGLECLKNYKYDIKSVRIQPTRGIPYNIKYKCGKNLMKWLTWV